MISAFLLKIYNFPRSLRMKWSIHFNRWYFKAKGIKYGQNMNIMGVPYITGDGGIEIGYNFMMTNGEGINPICSNMHGSIHTEKNAHISIGDNVGMSATRLWISRGLTIGNNVKIGACSLIIDTDTHPLDYNIRRISNEGAKTAAITIEDDVWIGAHCIILKGVTIGARSIIGAGSIVTKDIPADYIAAGNPCKVIRKLTE